jgi:hypothetical protein
MVEIVKCAKTGRVLVRVARTSRAMKSTNGDVAALSRRLLVQRRQISDYVGSFRVIL